MTWTYGASYNGLFSYNEPTKNGVFKFINGDSYQGSWSSNVMNGLGKYIHTTGTVYNG